MHFTRLPCTILANIFRLCDQQIATRCARICRATHLPAAERLIRYLEVYTHDALRHLSDLARLATDPTRGKLGS